MGQARQGCAPPAGPLGLGDAVSLLLGIVVGVGIFQTPALVFRQVAEPWQALALWLLGGVFSLAGALCYAELATAYPRSGGEYVYLTRAYGRGIGFLFAWAQLAVLRSGGGVAAVAYVFADGAGALWGLGPGERVVCAALAIGMLTLVNLAGVNPGRRTQNLLTGLKLLGLAGVVVAGFTCAAPAAGTTVAVPVATGSLAVALLFVLYTFDGWNEAAYVAAEVRDRRRTLPWALVLGTTLVTGIYLLVNAACLAGLGFEAARTSPNLLADVLALAVGAEGGRLLTVLILVSALGALQGTIFTAARVYSALGSDHRAFALLGCWSHRGTPVWSLVLQAVVSLGLVAGVGLGWGGQNGFDALVKCSAPVFWLFFLLTGLSLFVSRVRDRDLERPFRVPLYPLTPLVFCGMCAAMLTGSLLYARAEALLGLAILLAGVPAYWMSQAGRPVPLPPADAPRPPAAAPELAQRRAG